jgi:DndB-like DNA-sulfur modification-associated protein
MIDRTLKVIEVNPHEAVASMRVGDVLDVALPASAFLPKAKLSPLEQREVDRLRHLHDLIQRDYEGQKKRNAEGPLADYIREEWFRSRNGAPAGFLPAFILYLPEKLDIDEDTGSAHIRGKGVYMDGESRGQGLLVNVGGDELDEREVDALLDEDVAVHIVHGISDPKVIAKYFADVNGKGVGVNPNLAVMADYTDPFTEITKRVFTDLGIELETRKRQVSVKSDAVMTGLLARTMIAAVAKGVGVVQYGAKAIPDDDVDTQKLERVSKEWLSRVFEAFEPEQFKDKAYILRSVPVAASLGALGKAFYEGSPDGQKVALKILSDDSIDWTADKHWNGLAGKVSPTTGRFAVGGGKEYAYATWNALTDRKSGGAKQIRHEIEPVKTAA